ncbi:methyltransferase domain-containing protein, partial [Leptolyngbya sp. FACHB-36]|uniref:methyltransferase domain-containing protein n=1 Tax=Leptolyngbya sp. FACHB-36 TaxID=2692808 RepID=UPI0016806B92|nr:methyltransferase domain-containing protein [Leptolyngbya sp. FACHB-36]
MRKDLHEDNRLSWNQATKAHNSHKGDQAKFLREGGSTLFPEEIELLGDLANCSLLHLQCNSGQDTLSLAQLGAVVTGVDISDEAISVAQTLSIASGIPATFYRPDVFDWLQEAADRGDRFDRVFSSYGAVCWLSNLTLWANGIAAVLNPSGRFVLVDFHPVALAFDENLQYAFSYFSDEPLTVEDGISDYVAASKTELVPWGYEPGIENFRNSHRSHEFAWGLGQVVTALLQAGLTLHALYEYPYSNGCKLFEQMREGPGRRLFPPQGVPNLPLMYGIV